MGIAFGVVAIFFGIGAVVCAEHPMPEQKRSGAVAAVLCLAFLAASVALLK